MEEADLVESDCKTALTVTVGGLGGAFGAMNRPEALIVPIAGFPPGIVLTCQATSCALAVNCTGAPTKGCAEVGDTVTITGGGGVEEVEDTRPPQEFKNIVDNKERAQRSDKLEHKSSGGGEFRSWC